MPHKTKINIHPAKNSAVLHVDETVITVKSQNQCWRRFRDENTDRSTPILPPYTRGLIADKDSSAVYAVVELPPGPRTMIFLQQDDKPGPDETHLTLSLPYLILLITVSMSPRPQILEGLVSAFFRRKSLHSIDDKLLLADVLPQCRNNREHYYCLGHYMEVSNSLNPHKYLSETIKHLISRVSGARNFAYPSSTLSESSYGFKNKALTYQGWHDLSRTNAQCGLQLPFAPCDITLRQQIAHYSKSVREYRLASTPRIDLAKFVWNHK